MPLAPDVAAQVFGDNLAQAQSFADLLAEHGVERGLIGPREVDRLWERHLLNSAAIGECVPDGATVVDIGSGAGFPGIPLAIARPDLTLTLVEPMARRIAWLEFVVDELKLDVRVLRGRAEERSIIETAGGADIVTARAVAPLARLCGWALPLTRPGGEVLALKGESAADEVARDQPEVLRLGGTDPIVRTCGQAFLEVPTTVVVIRRVDATPAAQRAQRRSGAGRDRTRWTRKDR